MNQSNPTVGNGNQNTGNLGNAPTFDGTVRDVIAERPGGQLYALVAVPVASERAAMEAGLLRGEHVRIAVLPAEALAGAGSASDTGGGTGPWSGSQHSAG